MKLLVVDERIASHSAPTGDGTRTHDPAGHMLGQSRQYNSQSKRSSFPLSSLQGRLA